MTQETNSHLGTASSVDESSAPSRCTTVKVESAPMPQLQDTGTITVSSAVPGAVSVITLDSDSGKCPKCGQHSYSHPRLGLWHVCSSGQEGEVL
jgi:hypothetical protein